MEFKLMFNASVSPDIHFIVALETANQYQIFNSSNFGFGGGPPGQGHSAASTAPSWTGRTPLACRSSSGSAGSERLPPAIQSVSAAPYCLRFSKDRSERPKLS
jgi:hypothetical protein